MGVPVLGLCGFVFRVPVPVWCMAWCVAWSVVGCMVVCGGVFGEILSLCFQNWVNRSSGMPFAASKIAYNESWNLMMTFSSSQDFGLVIRAFRGLRRPM